MMEFFHSLGRFFSGKLTSMDPVLESLYVWLSVIAILIVLMFCFNCFTSPLKIAAQKYRRIQRISSELMKIKTEGGVFMTPKMIGALKTIQGICIKIERLTQMYRYEYPEHIEVRELSSYTNRILNSVKATLAHHEVSNEEKAIKALMKNINKQSNDAIKFLVTLNKT